MGHVACAVNDQMHHPSGVKLTFCNQALEFDNGGERLSIHATLLHSKCIGQELLERFAIEGGTGTHARGATFCGCTAGWASGPNQFRGPTTAVSHRADALSIATRLNAIRFSSADDFSALNCTRWLVTCACEHYSVSRTRNRAVQIKCRSELFSSLKGSVANHAVL